MAKTPAKKKSAPKAKATAPKCVRMVRDPETSPPPHSADVHPNEVEEYRSHGFKEA